MERKQTQDPYVCQIKFSTLRGGTEKSLKFRRWSTANVSSVLRIRLIWLGDILKNKTPKQGHNQTGRTARVAKSGAANSKVYGKLIALFGQAASQARHSIQSSGRATTALPSTMSITLTGQTSAQAPAPLHFFKSTTGGIFTPLFAVSEE